MDNLIKYISSGVGLSSKKRKKRRKYTALIKLGSHRHGDMLLSSDCDSSDDDYIPEKMKKKNISSKSSQKTLEDKRKRLKEQPIYDAADQSISEGYGSVWNTQVPEELLLKIFQLVVADHKLGQSASKVCRLWRRIACDPSLWSRLDLSYGWIVSPLKAVKSLSEDGRTTHLQHVSVSGCKQVNARFIKILVDEFSELKSLDISSCTNVSAVALQMIASRLLHLEHLNASEIHLTGGRVTAICNVIKANQRSLKSLELSSKVQVSAGSEILKKLSEMNGLTTLDISGFMCSTADLLIKALKQHAPTLKILRMSRCFVTNFQSKNLEQSFSYPELIEFTAAEAKLGSALSFSHILKEAQCLKHIDVRGWCTSQLTCLQKESPHTLPPLQTLNLRSVYWESSIELDLSQISESLEELDISWMSCNEAAFTAFFDNLMPASNLKSLYCVGMPITMRQLRSILDSCSKLQRIDLESCRRIKRGLKRCHSSPRELKALREQI
ncbi:F-box/LRR-repeat protein 6-like isoform X2 [Watersipora subatra]|uniref:F-box/LRR-repeat protein 6-like isoform X2 n=1 Tax=Watersipora subatra TaxID=2589382 RepID=UPI00355C76B1